MLNKIRPALGRVLTPVGQAVARTGVSPNAITVIGTVGVAAGALVLFPRGEFFWGTMVITAFVLFDMLDGAVARVTGKISAFGAFLDSTMDRVADAAIFAGLMIGLYRGDQETLAGVALSYGPALDPTYEMAVVAPMHGFKLLMVRTVAVLTAVLGLSGLATLALPGYGLGALAWLLPALALTSTGLVLSARLGPVLAPSLVGGAWVALLLAAHAHDAGDTLVPFTAAGQGVAAAVVALAGGLLFLVRDRFDRFQGDAV